MPRYKRGIKVDFEMDRMGHVEIRPVSDRWAKAFQQQVKDNGGGDSLTAFMQGMEVDELQQYFTSSQWQDLTSGYGVIIIMDPWIVGHFYGYDAHLVAEMGISDFWKNRE